MSWDDYDDNYDEYDDYDLDGYDETEADDYLLSERADNDKYDIDNYDRYEDMAPQHSIKIAIVNLPLFFLMTSFQPIYYIH